MKRPRLPVSDSDKSFLLDDSVFYEIQYALGVCEHDSTDYCAWEMINYSRIGHARLLADFFQNDIASCSDHIDDLVSEDFGFSPRLLDGISRDELRKINKGMFHLSCRRAGRPLAEKQWDNRLLNAVHARSIEFIDHLLSPRCPSGISVNGSQWGVLLTILRSGRELHINQTDKGKAFGVGRELASGLSELTLWTQSAQI